MTKERRLGRGLEALLGRVGGRTDPPEKSPTPPVTGDQGPSAADPAHEVPSDQPYGGMADYPYGATAPPLNVVGPESVAAEPDAVGQTPEAGSPSVAGPLRVDVARIDSNPFQPRKDFDDAELQSLAESISAHGLLQPIVVRRNGDRFQLIVGERRLRAASKMGWTDVPVEVVEADDRQMAELAIIENMQRKDLNALEKAASFQRYLEQYGCTQEELAGRLNLDRSTIANLIRLLELPGPVQDAVRQGKITQGHARALLPLGDEREQIEFSERIQKEGMSVRQTEAVVQETIRAADGEGLRLVGLDGTHYRPGRAPNEHIAALEQEFRTALGTKVKLTHTSRGRGKLVIHFTSHEEFERLRKHLCDPGRPDAQGHFG